MTGARSYLKDHLLIAMPGMADPNFVRSVTYLCEHNEQGAMGIRINQVSGMRMGDVLAQMQIKCKSPEIIEQTVLIGGPVQQEHGFVLHEKGEQEWESTLPIATNLRVTTSRDILAAIAAGSGPPRALLALGYAGWAAGQLEHELRENAWISVAVDHRVLFDTPIEGRWHAALALLGVDPAALSDAVGHA
ncbi:MAG: YqgE/AlgH family protein [Lysobacterales bacterium]